MLYFCPILHSDLKKIERKWNDQCHYFKRMIVNTDFNVNKLQDNKLGTYTRKSKIQRNMLMASVFTYLSTTCFPLRATDRSSNVQYRKCSYFPYNRNCPVISAPLLWHLSSAKISRYGHRLVNELNRRHERNGVFHDLHSTTVYFKFS